ncbi:MAG: SDR family NAD(P)-dependent oxidoreductase [Solirubrobacterales bacterium]|nr:SDR family NAD(P)-dependent oxidoreductase [Solirubrobacterales bacterium]
MDLGLADRIAVVAGAGGALGSATVRMLVSEGAQVVAATDDTTKPLPGLDDAVRRVKLDLAMPGAAEALIAKATDHHGRVDVVINRVGPIRVRPEGVSRYRTTSSTAPFSSTSSSPCAPAARRWRPSCHDATVRS